MLAHREENELLIKAMVSSVNLGIYLVYLRPKSFPGGSDGKESACNAGDPGLNPRSGRSPGEGNGYHSSILARLIPWTEEAGGL